MSLSLRIWLLILIPLGVYGPAVMREYAMRDDYAFLREVREEPGKVVRFAASQGRPLYGALLETSYEHTGTVERLRWLRLASLALLIGVGIMLWYELDSAGWPQFDALALGLGVTLLPSSQIIASWAIGWPWALALLLAMAGFSAVQMELEKGGMGRVIGIIGGGFIYLLSALIYPSNTLFAVVPLAALALTKDRRSPQELLRWVMTHVGVMVAALLGYFGMLRLLFVSHIFAESPRMQIESHPFTKLLWFVWQPVANALALLPLRDDFHSGELVFWAAVLAVVAFLVWILRGEHIRGVPQAKLAWFLCLGVLPWLAAAVSLTAAERSTGYRTLAALSGLALTVVIVGLRRMPLSPAREPWLHRAGLAALLLGAAWTAAHNSLELVALPQGREWALVRDAVDALRLKEVNPVYVITPSVDDRSTVRMHRDEFGSLSADSDWVPREMFAAAVHDRFPQGLPPQFRLAFAQGRTPPAAGSDTVVIDLRQLRKYRP